LLAGEAEGWRHRPGEYNACPFRALRMTDGPSWTLPVAVADPMDVDPTPREEIRAIASELLDEMVQRAVDRSERELPSVSADFIGYDTVHDFHVIRDDPAIVARGPVLVAKPVGPDPMDVDLPGANLPALPEYKCNGLRTTTLADALGVTAFRKKRELIAAAAHSVAKYRSIDQIDGEDVDVEARVGYGESILQSVNNGLFGRTKKHTTRHRCANRYHRRVAIVKALVDMVKFEAPGVFTGSDADRRALHLIVRRVVKSASEDGVQLADGHASIRNQEKAWYLKAVCTSYYIREEDDEFWDKLAVVGSAITA